MSRRLDLVEAPSGSERPDRGEVGGQPAPLPWTEVALQLVVKYQQNPLRAARVLAALNAAMSDALVACWRAKFEHWTLRPVNAIRDKLDPGF